MFSVTATRHTAAQKTGKESKNLIPNHEVLKKREVWKYALIKKSLQRYKRSFEFEYPIGKYIYDLALLDSMTLVEFDGKYHRATVQRQADAKKDALATENGFRVLRIPVKQGTRISGKIVRSFLMRGTRVAQRLGS